MMEIRPYEEGDMEYVRQNPFQEEVKNYPDLPVPANTYTCVFDGDIVAVGGIKLFFEGVGEAWIIFTKPSRKEGIFGIIACRAIKRELDKLIAKLKLRRCEAQARADFPKAIKFVKALGFGDPYVRKYYCPDGSDMILYSQVFDEHV